MCKSFNSRRKYITYTLQHILFYKNYPQFGKDIIKKSKGCLLKWITVYVIGTIQQMFKRSSLLTQIHRMPVLSINQSIFIVRPEAESKNKINEMLSCMMLSFVNKISDQSATGTSFLLLFAFLISLMHHHQPALLHHNALLLKQLLTFLMAFSILMLKPSFSPNLSLNSHPSLPQTDLMEFWLLAV